MVFLGARVSVGKHMLVAVLKVRCRPRDGRCGAAVGGRCVCLGREVSLGMSWDVGDIGQLREIAFGR